MDIHKARLTPEEINKIASSGGYHSIYNDFVSLLKRSRENEISNKQLFNLQLELAEKIIKAEKSITFFKTKADREKQNKEWFSREVHKAQRMAYKKIADGIAWRYLNFDRASLRQIAEHNPTGHLSKGFIGESLKAEFTVKNSDIFVILNDLTNFLRFGDLTIISKNKVFIDEVKLKGKTKRRQKQQLASLLEKLNKKEFSIGDTTANFLSIPGFPNNFLSEVEKIIIEAKSDERGIYHKRVSPYLWVSCVYSDKLLTKDKDFEKTLLPRSPFRKDSDNIFVPISNLLMFNEFSPNIAPYTIFPFTEELIADLVFGKCILKSHISQKGLNKSIQGKGWSVKFPTRQEITEGYNSIKRPEDIKKLVRNPKYHIHFKKERFSTTLPREILQRIDREFLSVKAIVKSLEYTKDNYNPLDTGGYIVTGFQDEEKMWI